MANVNSAFGLMPIGKVGGAPYVAALRKCVVPASDGTALFVGDPVIYGGTADVNGYPTILRATAAGGNYISGVVVGFEPDPLYMTQYRTASTLRYALIETDPRTLFEIMEDAVGGAMALTSVMGNVDLVAGAGSIYSGLSGFMADSSTANTTNTLQLRVQSIIDRIDNAAAAAYQKLAVSINLHTELNLTGI